MWNMGNKIKRHLCKSVHIVFNCALIWFRSTLLSRLYANQIFRNLNANTLLAGMMLLLSFSTPNFLAEVYYKKYQFESFQ